MSQNVISLRVSDEMKDRLDQLAAATRRPRSFLAQEALAEYLDRHGWQVAAIDEAVEAAGDGQFASHEAVADWLSSWGTENEKQPPVAGPAKRAR
ncbi:putative transcriptional regulator [Rhizobium azooxidifex]|uniref:Putative transcriptional regulator n=1 Tax=Mycoplana azooxidifex TaxID=1636188 RepID=A0A7W6GJJ1_9HYPH|nr:CopG family ribbon-helix-helix protein [Mycoplana azooxidifex]MBB3977312.1 putative transcriptional regulator [Mycoplana azooxidifex]